MTRVNLTAITVFMSLLLFAQTPGAVNYQAVVRGADGKIIKNSTVQFKFSILQSSSSGTVVYEETHLVTTNAFGLVNLEIGEGDVLSGVFSSIAWKDDAHFLKVELDVDGGTSYVYMNTQRMSAVPYALHAETVANSDNDNTNELQTISRSGDDLSLSDGGGTVSVADADADASNELQTISKSGNTLTLSNNGGSVSVEDADANATNEIQTLSKSGSTVSLSQSGGSFTDEVYDGDSSITNELQTISKSGNTLTLSNNGGSVSVEDADANATNEIQTLSKSGSTVSLSQSGGSFTDEVYDGDSSITNELQTISKSGNTLTLSNNGGSVSVEDADANATNEIQTLSKSGSMVSLSQSGGSFTDEVYDGDSSITNELQTISKSGNTLTLSNNGGSVSVEDADANATNEIQTLSKSGSTVSLSQSGGSFTDEVYDGDSSITNELQTISKSGNTLTLSNNGGSVSVEDADANATNEIQTLSKSGSMVSLSQSGGSFTDEVYDGDSSITNELQTISKSGNTLTLSNNGGSVSVEDADANATNEIQTLSKSGSTVSLSQSGGSFTDEVYDGDSSITNELQTISKSGNTLTLSNNGGSVSVEDADASTSNELQELTLTGDSLGLTLSSTKIDLSQFGGGGGQWTANGASLYNATAANIGVGTSSPLSTFTFHIQSPDSIGNGLRIYNNADIGTGNVSSASFVTDRVSTDQGNTYGIATGAHFKPQTTGNNSTYGIYSIVTSEPDDISGQKTYGIFSNVTRRDSGYGTTYGFYNYIRNYGNDGAVIGDHLYTTSSSPDELTGSYVYAQKSAGTTGFIKGSFVYADASPSTGADALYGQHVQLVSAPDAASSAESYGMYLQTQRSDSGSGATKALYIDLDHSGLDGDVYGTHVDLELTGANPDPTYGQYTSVVKQGDGLLYGNRVFVNRSSGYAGKTYGNYINVSTQNAASTSSIYNTYGQYIDISSTPASDAWTLGTYSKITRSGPGTGPTVLRYDDLIHDSSGYVYGNYMNISRTSSSNSDPTYGAYNLIEIDNGGLSYGEYTSLTLGSSTSTTTGDAIGNLAAAFRYGAGDHHVYGLYGAGYNYATGTGIKYAYGVYGKATANNTLGFMYTYGVYGTATGGDAQFAGYFLGDIYTSGSYLPSDPSLKTNIRATTSALDRLMRLKVYDYQYDQERFNGMQLPKGDQTGFLSDEMFEIYPELTKTTHQPALSDEALKEKREQGEAISDIDENGYTFRSVNYAGLVPHLTRALQEQQAVIEQQAGDIEQMKRDIAEMRAILDSLQSNH